MKKVKLIYNPNSGQRSFPKHIDYFVQKFQQSGNQVTMFRSLEKGDIQKSGFSDIDSQAYNSIIVAGGDGTINEVITAMIEKDINVPLGILPFGTANDFANNIGMPINKIEECCDIILQGKIKHVDVGKVNEKYFINVLGFGLMATVSQNINNDLKKIGKLGYYIKGIEQIPSLRPIPVRVITDSRTIEDNIYLMLVLNGKCAGGFEKLCTNAVLDDSLFDVLIVKAKPLHEIGKLFIDILQGKHLSNENIIYLKEKHLKIECLDKYEGFYESDIDGEKGPNLPLEITLLPKKIEIYVNPISTSFKY
ncbi:YegS/Rv2252/BmrU family lipid kinase [Clostridium formicaceticum]|uniref:Diacylglycerol kinase n=1 Tax=Clostridium formicaceticum TaxID=1497 RepID=A0AAC9RHZ7_9CLOT|nr:YegS/Rv2252/BmrU family lipid kinase [Clostridium formicaceticum]AOY75538.1 diacylglycerol kinase [Clostridium formicaceticum]ARE85832.1 Diacylglycerol kinase [Clostridium formicaceticum]